MANPDANEMSAEPRLSDPLAAQVPGGDVPAAVAGRVRWLALSLFALGLLALIFPFFSTLAATALLGGLFLLAGLFKLASAITMHPLIWRGVLKGVWGLVYIIGGGLMLYAPLAGAWSLTIVLAAMLLGGGIASIAWAWTPPKPPGALWMAASGLLSIVLGLAVAWLLPVAAFWFPGVVAGVDLISSAIALLAMDRDGARTRTV